METTNTSRRNFIATAGIATAGIIASPRLGFGRTGSGNGKKKLAMVGTGIRGTGFWGKTIMANYPDIVEFVGLCDINPGRLEFAKTFMGVNCPVFSDFTVMLKKTKPDIVIVTTIDNTHDEFIIKALDMGVDVITEKPLTTDEIKCQAILDAERRSGRKLIMGFNYRWGTLFSAIKEQLSTRPIGTLTSVDFHWYLNTYHGTDYFRRWHGIREKSGTLLVHKASHHFDLLNWFIDSDPVEVFAHGALEHYGKNGPYRADKCRSCPHSKECRYFFDITKDKLLTDLYVKNEHHDGYIRDNCVFRNEIDIFDKMAVQIKYANNVQVSYSLTTYSPYEGWQIAFNGTNGRLESWEDIPWRMKEKVSQADRHTLEMKQESAVSEDYDEIVFMENRKDYEMMRIPRSRSGHGGGDKRLQDKIFRNPGAPDPYGHAAGTRDGAMALLIGVAARKSIDTGKPVRIEDISDLKPSAKRLV